MLYPNVVGGAIFINKLLFKLNVECFMSSEVEPGSLLHYYYDGLIS